ncbi:MAG: hypothetical protein KKF48_03975 [Nanoarchaeota archaeon]|nr:hypothetical protein [Nanoarchaeota archaeon]
MYKDRAKEKGGCYTPVQYEAENVNGIFLGKYKMQDTIPVTLGWGMRQKEKGKFIVYCPTLENQKQIKRKQVKIS